MVGNLSKVKLSEGTKHVFGSTKKSTRLSFRQILNLMSALEKQSRCLLTTKCRSHGDIKDLREFNARSKLID